MFKGVFAKICELSERLARWQAQDYLNTWLAVRTGAPKGTKYTWGLHGEGATWRWLMDGDSHNRLIAYTTVPHPDREAYPDRRVLIGGWFSFVDILTQEGFQPPINVHTAVLDHLPIDTGDWMHRPEFTDSASFAMQVARH